MMQLQSGWPDPRECCSQNHRPQLFAFWRQPAAGHAGEWGEATTGRTAMPADCSRTTNRSTAFRSPSTSPTVPQMLAPIYPGPVGQR
jgi:hypothetical protein